MCGTLVTSFTPKKDDTTKTARHTFTKVGQPLNIVFAKKVKTRDEKVMKEEKKDNEKRSKNNHTPSPFGRRVRGILLWHLLV